MSVQTPMGEGAKFILQKDMEGGPDILLFDNGDGKVRQIAWSALPDEEDPDDTDAFVKSRFDWLCGSVAVFHRVPLERTEEGI